MAWDPKRDLPRVRDTSEWPLRPFLAVVRSTSDDDRVTGFIREDDVLADEEIRVLGSTRESWEAISFLTKSLADLDLPVVVRYDSLERMFADEWEVD
jgi:hypothetical protein